MARRTRGASVQGDKPHVLWKNRSMLFEPDANSGTSTFLMAEHSLDEDSVG
jgi:hypothetical protein